MLISPVCIHAAGPGASKKVTKMTVVPLAKAVTETCGAKVRAYGAEMTQKCVDMT